MLVVDSSEEEDDDEEEVSVYDCDDEDDEDDRLINTASINNGASNDYVIEHELIDNVSRDEDEDDEDAEDYSQYFYNEFDAINDKLTKSNNNPVNGSNGENVVIIQKTNLLGNTNSSSNGPSVNYEYYDYEKANGATVAAYFAASYAASSPANGVSSSNVVTDRAQTPAFFQTNYYARSSTRSKLNNGAGTGAGNNIIQHSSKTTPTPTAMLSNGRYPYNNNNTGGSSSNNANNGSSAYYSRAHHHSYFSRRSGAAAGAVGAGGGFYSSWYGSVPSLDIMCHSSMGGGQQQQQQQQRHEQHRQSNLYN
jgi:hypothetical protein